MTDFTILPPSFVVVSLGLFGVVLWLFVRRRYKRMWFPIVRVLTHSRQKLPRLTFRQPPLVSFLCYLMAGLAFVVFTLRPKIKLFTPFEPNQTRVHIFVDMSPSMSANVTIFQLKQRVADLWKALQGSARITMSTTHGDAIYDLTSAEQVGALLQGLDFHRAGARLGSTLKGHLAQTGELDRLFIVSDRDQHSWSGFQWEFLSQDSEIFHVDVEVPDFSRRTNIFISSAYYTSPPQSLTMDWEVEITQAGMPQDANGTLKVLFKGAPITSVPWHLTKARSRTVVNVAWPVTKTPANQADQLLWQLDLAQPDAIVLDNEFRTRLFGAKSDINIVAAPSGEQFLDDPVYQLTMTLGVLGFSPHRIDDATLTKNRWAPGGANRLDILVGGTGVGIERFCPISLETERLAAKSPDSVNRTRTKRSKVWLIPGMLDVDFQELCVCYHRLILSETVGQGVPDYCSDVHGRNHWVSFLKSVGAKQVGGDVSDTTGALAMVGSDSGGAYEVLAFTVPLRPALQIGLTHGHFPTMVKELLKWQGLLADDKAFNGWPRIDDLTRELPSMVTQQGMPTSQILSQGNIPIGESMMSTIPPASLPPRWSQAGEINPKQIAARQDQSDPLPWVRNLAGILMAAMLIEFVLRAYHTFRSGAHR